MWKVIFISVLLVLCISCKNHDENVKSISKVEIEHLIQDSLLSVRALEIDNYFNFSFATADGWVGGSSINEIEENADTTLKLESDSIIPNFRTLAITNRTVFALSIGSPSLLFKINKHSYKLVYQETHPKAFYDSMDFWNDQEGIAIGDPTEDCMSIIITRDGGETWTKLLCDDLPKAIEGEAAFAASDTNIAIVGDQTWVATGGKVSRILYSPDKGKSWKVYSTPIMQGEETSGIFSIDFYDELNGFAIGGDYTKPEINVANKIRTSDGGKTWELVAQNQNPGYRSCVQYVPNGKGKELVAVGFKGIDYSSDAGNSWKHLSDEGFYTIRFLNDSVAYAAGNGRVSKLVFR